MVQIIIYRHIFIYAYVPQAIYAYENGHFRQLPHGDSWRSQVRKLQEQSLEVLRCGAKDREPKTYCLQLGNMT